jgi:hypothetical protein
VIAKGYQSGYYTHPSTTFKIWRLYERVVPQILKCTKGRQKPLGRQKTVFKTKPRETLFPGCP